MYKYNKQTNVFVVYISVLGFDWPCKISKVYKAPRLLFGENGVPAVTRKSAIANCKRNAFRIIDNPSQL